MRWVMRILAAAMLAALVAAPSSAQAPRRVALVVANANYAGYAPLPNTAVDAGLVAEALRRAGFSVVDVKTDQGIAGFRTALGAFQTRAQGAEVAAVYYAGHGIEVNGRNWLIPTDAQLENDGQLAFQAIDADLLVQAAGGARTRIVVLDACRENPFAGRMRRTGRVTRDASPGLGAPLGEGVRGTLLMYSAAPGELAADGVGGQGSPFARAFARYLPEPGVELRVAAGKIADAVFEETRQAQLPFTSSSLSGAEIYLVARMTAPVPAPVFDPRQSELAYWNSCCVADATADDFNGYLAKVASREFPGTYAEMARRRLGSLGTQSTVGSRADTGNNTSIGPRLLRTLVGLSGDTYAPVFSPDGQFVAVSSSDRTARIWRVADGESIATISEPGCYSGVLSFSLNSALVFGKCNSNARVWTVATGAPAGQIRGLTGDVGSHASSQNGAMVAYATRNGTRLVNTQTRAVLGTIPESGSTLVFSPDNSDLLIGDLSRRASFWDIRDPAQPRKVWSAGDLGAISAASIDSVGVTIGSQDGRIVVLSRYLGSVQSRLPGQGGYVQRILNLPSGSVLTVTAGTSQIAQWTLGAGEPKLTRQLRDQASPEYAQDVWADVSRNGLRIATIVGNLPVALWDAQLREPIARIAAPDGEIARSLKFSPDSRVLAITYRSGIVQLWSAE